MTEPRFVEVLEDGPTISQRLLEQIGADRGGTIAQLIETEGPATPADFEAFWRHTQAQARSIPLNLEVASCDLSTDRLDVQIVYYQSWDQRRIGGWLVTPRGKTIDALVLAGHGYGGRSAPDLTNVYANTAVFYPCLRGFGLSKQPDLPDNGFDHVQVGLDRRANYIHRGCVVDLWQAAKVLQSLYPDAGEQLFYRGGSFCGGMGALALPWGPRFDKAHLEVPSHGNHRLRVALPCTGSGREIAKAYRQRGESVLDVVDYYDAAIAASFIQTPTQVAVARVDPAVPPAGQMAVYQAIPAPKRLLAFAAGHYEFPELAEQNRQVQRHIADWFGLTPLDQSQ